MPDAMRVLLATPANAGLTIQYTQSLARLMNDGARYRPEVSIEPLFLPLSVIYRSRNLFASRALEQAYTHVVFIDSDMGFQSSAVFRLLDSEHDVCGCLYPKRSLDDAAWFDAARRADGPQAAKLLAQDFVLLDNLIKHEDGNRSGYAVRNGFVETHNIGMGLSCISRAALARMVERCENINMEKKGHVYDAFPQVNIVYKFFDPISRRGLDTLDEDISFCRRWVEECGGKIFALIDEEVTHVGEGVFTGNALHKLQAQR